MVIVWVVHEIRLAILFCKSRNCGKQWRSWKWLELIRSTALSAAWHGSSMLQWYLGHDSWMFQDVSKVLTFHHETKTPCDHRLLGLWSLAATLSWMSSWHLPFSTRVQNLTCWWLYVIQYHWITLKDKFCIISFDSFRNIMMFNTTRLQSRLHVWLNCFFAYRINLFSMAWLRYLIWKLPHYVTSYHQDTHVPPHFTLYNQARLEMVKLNVSTCQRCCGMFLIKLLRSRWCCFSHLINRHLKDVFLFFPGDLSKSKLQMLRNTSVTTKIAGKYTRFVAVAGLSNSMALWQSHKSWYEQNSKSCGCNGLEPNINISDCRQRCQAWASSTFCQCCWASLWHTWDARTCYSSSRCTEKMAGFWKVLGRLHCWFNLKPISTPFKTLLFWCATYAT